MHITIHTLCFVFHILFYFRDSTTFLYFSYFFVLSLERDPSNPVNTCCSCARTSPFVYVYAPTLYDRITPVYLCYFTIVFTLSLLLHLQISLRNTSGGGQRWSIMPTNNRCLLSFSAFRTTYLYNDRPLAGNKTPVSKQTAKPI